MVINCKFFLKEICKLQPWPTSLSVTVTIQKPQESTFRETSQCLTSVHREELITRSIDSLYQGHRLVPRGYPLLTDRILLPWSLTLQQMISQYTLHQSHHSTVHYWEGEIMKVQLYLYWPLIFDNYLYLFHSSYKSTLFPPNTTDPPKSRRLNFFFKPQYTFSFFFFNEI